MIPTQSATEHNPPADRPPARSNHSSLPLGAGTGLPSSLLSLLRTGLPLLLLSPLLELLARRVLEGDLDLDLDLDGESRRLELRFRRGGEEERDEAESESELESDPESEPEDESLSLSEDDDELQMRAMFSLALATVSRRVDWRGLSAYEDDLRLCFLSLLFFSSNNR